MADINKTIEIIFGAVDNTGSTLNGIGERIQSSTDSISNISGPLASVTTSVLKTEAAILGLAAAYGGFAISKAIEFQTAQTDLAKVLNDTDPDINSFTESVIGLSEEYGVASSIVLQGVANFKQAGFTAEESAQLQKDALDLVIAGDIDAARASDVLVTSLKGFNAESSEAARFTEALNNVSNKYATDLGELSAGLGRISPVAEQMGFSFEEATGLITPIIEVFRSGPEAANALRTGLLKLIDDSKPVADALAEIGVNQLDINGQMRTGREIFLDVGEAFKTLDQNQKLVITSQLVGVEQASKMITVFDDLAKTQEITAVAMEQTGSVTEEVAIRLASSAKQVDILQQSFNNLAVSVGTELLPSFSSTASGAGEILQAFRKVVDNGGLGDLFDALGEQGESFGEFLSDIAKALPEAFNGLEFDGLIESFSSLQGSISGLFGDLDLTEADGLREALQGLVDFISLLTNASSGAIEGIQPLIDGIVLFLEELANSDSSSQSFIGNIGGIAVVIDSLIPALNFLGTALAAVGGALSLLGGLKSVDLFKNISLGLTSISPTNVALAGAIGSVTFAINENIKAYDELQSREKDLIDTEENLNQNRAKIVETLDEITDRTGVTVKSMDELNNAVDEGSLVFDEVSGKYISAADAIIDYDKVVNDAAGNQDGLVSSSIDVSGALDLLGLSLDGTSKKTQEFASSQDGVSNAVSSNVDAVQDFAEATDELSEAQKIAQEDAQQLQLTLLQIASDERIANIKFNAELNAAEVEANAKRAVAAFESVSSVVDSTTQGISDIFSTGPADGDTFGFQFDSLLESAEKRADQALNNATELNAAQVEFLRAKTESLIQGDAVINVNADGLQPELVAVLKGLVEFVQIEANNEGLELLLGLDGVI